LIHEEVSRPRASQRVTDSSCENREPGLQVRLDDTGGGRSPRSRRRGREALGETVLFSFLFLDSPSP
jgi:hypothetical protein